MSRVRVRRRFLALAGPFAGRTESPARCCRAGRLELHLAADAAVTAEVWRRRPGRGWTIDRYVGTGCGQLLKVAPGGEWFRLAVVGTANGTAGLLEV